LEIQHVYISRDVASKIFRKHNVVTKEVRDVFSNAYFKPKIFRSDRIPEAYVAYGRTLEGRYLMVAFFLHKKHARVITARDLTNKERKRYERK
jgi:uncharacterized DUF497 family protein